MKSCHFEQFRGFEALSSRSGIMSVSGPCIDSWPRIDSPQVRGRDRNVVDEKVSSTVDPLKGNGLGPQKKTRSTRTIAIDVQTYRHSKIRTLSSNVSFFGILKESRAPETTSETEG